MQLRPYQHPAADFLEARNFALLGDQMRVGKTAPAIIACKRVLTSIHKTGNGWPALVLVVCPAIGVLHWQSQFKAWAPGITPYVVTYDKCRTDIDALLTLNWDVLIVDESHYIGNPLARRSQAVFRLVEASTYAWFLTGTPITKHAGNVWYYLRRMKLTKLAYLAFCKEFCYHYKVRNRWVPKGTKVNMLNPLGKLLGRVMLRRTRKDVNPNSREIQYAIQPIDITPDLPEENGLLVPRVADHDALKLSRLEVAVAKVGHIAEHVGAYLDADPDRRTVIFGHHTEPIYALAGLLMKKGFATEVITGVTTKTERAQTQRRFADGELQAVVANIQAGGTVIDLSAANHGFFIELSWLPSENQQAASRLVSVTDDGFVTFDLFSVPGSVDEAVQRVLLSRNKEISTTYQQARSVLQ